MNFMLRLLYPDVRTPVTNKLETGCAGLGVVEEKEKGAVGGIRTPAAQAVDCIFLIGSGGYNCESEVQLNGIIRKAGRKLMCQCQINRR
jgi:hypothetical protein